MSQEGRISSLKQAETGSFTTDRWGCCLVIMAAVSMAMASATPIHLHTLSLCSFCAEQTSSTQPTALLARQRHFSELDATSLGSMYSSFVL